MRYVIAAALLTTGCAGMIGEPSPSPSPEPFEVPPPAPVIRPPPPAQPPPPPEPEPPPPPVVEIFQEANESEVALGLVYAEPSTGRARLMLNPASSPTEAILDVVAGEELAAYSFGFNLPFDTTRAEAGALTAAAPVSRATIARGTLFVAASHTSSADVRLHPGDVLATVRFTVKPGATPGVIFAQASSAGVRNRAGTDVAEIVFGTLQLR